MKRRDLVFSPEAEDDLIRLFDLGGFSQNRFHVAGRLATIGKCGWQKTSIVGSLHILQSN
jgi:hypothetical protein